MKDEWRRFLIASALGATLILSSGPSKAGGSQSFTVYGNAQWVSTPGPDQTQAQTNSLQAALTVLTAKLFYPKARGAPPLVTYPDANGDFRFPDLPKDSYLLEIYYGGARPLYQRRLTVESDQALTIPIGQVKLVCSATIKENSAGLLGAEFQNRVAIAVSKIDLKKDGSALALTIGPAAGLALSKRGKPYFKGELPPSKLIASFKYNNQTYTLAGAIRSSQNALYFDGEVYR
jgi:hypothetical protein